MYRLRIQYATGDIETLWYGTTEDERLEMNKAFAVGAFFGELGIRQTLAFVPITLSSLVSA